MLKLESKRHMDVSLCNLHLSMALLSLHNMMVRLYASIYTDSEDAIASSISSLASHIIDTPKYLTVAHSGFDLPDSYAALTLDNGDMALFTSNRAEKRTAWTRVTTNGLFSVVAIHGRLFANVYYDDQLHLCEFDSEIGMDKWILVTISSDAADVSAAFSNVDVVQVLHSDGTYIGDKTVDSSNEIDLTGYTGNNMLV